MLCDFHCCSHFLLFRVYCEAVTAKEGSPTPSKTNPIMKQDSVVGASVEVVEEAGDVEEVSCSRFLIFGCKE